MKYISYVFAIFCIFLLFSSSLDAQIKTDQLGRVLVGHERSGQDGDTVLNLMVFGKNGEYRVGGKLSFGDFGRYVYYGWNVFVGEYGTTDTDQLWLHGKSGTYFTSSNGSSVWGYYDVNAGNAFRFNCDVYSNGILLTSDERLKENIRPLSGSLPLLQQMNGVSYFLKKPIMQTAVDTKTAEDNSMPSDKEKRDMAFFEKWEKDLQNSKDLRKGFVAQDLQKIFPELVSEDKDGMLSIDYIGLIPVIVESIKEQQQIIEDQSKRMQVLEKTVKALQGKSVLHSSTDESGTTGIADNAPNPFTNQTEIK